MKQDDKRCDQCFYGLKVTALIGKKFRAAIKCRVSHIPEIRGLMEWCGEGRWRDEHGILVGWTDPEIATNNGTSPSLISWIRMEDEKPFDEKPVLVKRGKGHQQEFAVDWWAEDTWDDSLDVTHWAHITEPEV